MYVRRVDKANADASGQILLSEINETIDVLARKYIKDAKMDGFRKGKVPISFIKNRHRESLQDEAEKICINAFCKQALNSLGVDPKELVGSPVVDVISRDDDALNISLKIGIVPNFSLDCLDECVPEFELPEVNPSMVDERIVLLSKRHGEIVDSDCTHLDKGCIADINFEGFIDGKGFEGSKVDGFNLEVGSGAFIPEIEDSLVGRKVGEEFEVDVLFPDDYAVKSLAGLKSKFKVRLNAIKERRVLQPGDELARKVLGDLNGSDVVTFETLKDRVKLDLEAESKLKLYGEELKGRVVDNMLSKIIFDVPQNIVEQEMRMLLNAGIQSMTPGEVAELRGSPQKMKDKLETYRDRATDSVRITFIIDAISKSKGITVSDNEVLQSLYYDATVMKVDPREMIKEYRDNNLIPAVRMSIMEDKVIHYLLDSAKSRGSE